MKQGDCLCLPAFLRLQDYEKNKDFGMMIRTKKYKANFFSTIALKSVCYATGDFTDEGLGRW
jgi:hypothetical protein